MDDRPAGSAAPRRAARARIGVVPTDASDPSPVRPTADDLLARVARGDDEAFAALYDELSPVVYGLCRRVLRDPAEAEEVAQEAFLQVWRTAPRYDPERGSARSWCTAIAHARAVDRVRSSQRRRAREDTALRPDPPPGDLVVEEVTVRLESERVRRALDELPGRQRESLVLAYYGGHTHTEISAMLGVPLGTVKTRIRDAIHRLRHLVHETGPTTGRGLA
jgi:RNA polymerase sigma-70 factor (ECF subfamily)